MHYKIITRIGLVLSICLLLTLSSCYDYHAVTAQIPLLEEKGDLSVSAAANVWIPAANVGVAYAPLNHVAVMAQGVICPTEQYFVSGSVGTFFPLKRSVFEFYGGGALGYEEDVGNRYSQLFAQCNYGWNGLCNNRVDFGFGLRSGLMIMYDYVTRDCFMFEPQLMFRVGDEHFKFTINLVCSPFQKAFNRHYTPSPIGFSFGVHYKL